MLLLSVERGGKVPLHQQVADRIRDHIDRGSLPAGSALPPTRVLAGQIGVNRTTVYRAYQELWALGYVEGRPGSYTRVRERTSLAEAGTKGSTGAIHWDELASGVARSAHESFLRYRPEVPAGPSAKSINFSALDMDPRLIPAGAFRKCLNSAMLREGAKLLGYAPHAGCQPLRRFIARRLQVHGIAVTEEEILITHGSQHALDLVLRLLASPGGVVALESPTYALGLPLVRLHGAEPAGVPMLAGGMDLDALERLLKKGRTTCVYTMPNFQNPTGISTSQTHRERLLNLCERHAVPLVEDGFEEEMKYFGKVALPIKSMDRNRVVIYLGTFSKVLMPGVRIGWVAAERACVERLTAIRRFADLSPGAPLQAGLEEFCRTGQYDLHLRRLHRAYRKRMQVLLSAMREHMPAEGVSWTEPAGGYLLWVELKDSRRPSAELCDHLRRSGVSVASGEAFFPIPPPYPCFRLSIATLDEVQIAEGVRRLGIGLNEFLEGSAPCCSN